VSRAQFAVETARQQRSLSALRASLMARRADTRTLDAIRNSTAQEAARTQSDLSRIASEAGVAVPANEVLFYPTLPVRVDAVTAKLGGTLSGSVMTVTNSRLTVDSSLSVDEANLVRPGNSVTIESQDLGIKTGGKVAMVADRPGTNKVDPTRVYFTVLPTLPPLSLAGTSVKLTIAVKSTNGAVLAVPPSALSLAGDGSSRVQVVRNGRTELVTVAPGLAAGGLVEVRPASGAQLTSGDLVVVGSTRSRPGAAR
jgi:hypothetical protein